MSERDRHDRGALVALALLLAAVVSVSFGDAWSRHSFEQEVRQNKQQHQNKQPADDRPPEPNLWPQFTPSDTYAQWVMSALAAVATITGVLGVVWIRQTLVETKRTADAALEANKTAREIGEAGTRAYVVCLTCYLVNLGVGQKPTARVQFKNIGSTPAANVTVRGTIVFGNYPQRAESINRALTSDAASTFGLAPETLPVTTYIDRMKVFTQEESDAIKAGKKALYVYVKIDYEDVFGRDNVSRIMFMYSQNEAHSDDDGGLPIAPLGNSFEWGKHKT